MIGTMVASSAWRIPAAAQNCRVPRFARVSTGATVALLVAVALRSVGGMMMLTTMLLNYGTRRDEEKWRGYARGSLLAWGTRDNTSSYRLYRLARRPSHWTRGALHALTRLFTPPPPCKYDERTKRAHVAFNGPCSERLNEFLSPSTLSSS